MANPANHLQLLILAAAAADAEGVLAAIKRAKVPVRGAFSLNPRSIIRASHIDLILACIGEAVPAKDIAAAYAETDQRVPLLVISAPGELDADAMHLLRAGAHGLLTPGDEAALVRAVTREWHIWATAQEAATLRERLKRSERHLQALLKAGGEGLQSGRHLDPRAAMRSLIGGADASSTSASGLMDLLSPEYREALNPLLDAQAAEQTPSPSSADPAGTSADALPALAPLQESAPDLTLKPSGDQQAPGPTPEPASRPPSASASAPPSVPASAPPSVSTPADAPAPAAKVTAQDEPLALQLSSEPSAVPPRRPGLGDLPPLTLATSEEPLPDLSEQPQPLSGLPFSDDELIEQIERALEKDGFKLAYQPIISLRGDSQERYSVLLRLLDDNRAFRAADDLLEPAARSGRMPEVDRWVIAHALRELGDRRQAGHRAHFVLSLSAALLQDQELLIWICDQLRQCNIRGNWVSFQISEQDIGAAGDSVVNLASGLRQVKSKVVVSSFGRNTDSELLLSEFPLDFVRLSPSLTENLTKDRLKQGRVKHLFATAQSRGIRSIAGCIEDERILAAIWSAGADYVQGKLLGRPSSVFELND
ncbi:MULTISPECIES: EAL domain-containing protein [Thiorhodovibrio]|uniref:EAL domain-containing protein n=1 Tax=Thiorhodovibrio TaxID=61593 RepID=UPI001913D606|nr:MULTISPECIES: EAL domain-containing protein [Thiorhodovibrio]MBK5971244.1 hypothetical protein [Thiorhodovibrio winogradskyi]WPL14609.1 Cyclic di-GMP phosphodiesterase YfgF [Thiorhodovibrio litoralis]